MKRFNFLLAAIILVLTMASIGCTTMAGTQDDYYDGQAVYGNRVYIDDPYRGTIMLERDPWTGRYYEMSGGHATPYYGYGNRVYSRGTYGRSYPSYRRNNNGNYNRNNSNNNQNNNRSSEQYQKDRNEARNKILGNH